MTDLIANFPSFIVPIVFITALKFTILVMLSSLFWTLKLHANVNSKPLFGKPQEHGGILVSSYIIIAPSL